MAVAASQPCGALLPFGEGALWKLGRCTRCMQLSLLGAALAFVGVLVARAAHIPTTPRYAVLTIAAGFTTLWLLHILTFVVRAERSYVGWHVATANQPEFDRLTIPVRALAQALRASRPQRSTLSWLARTLTLRLDNGGCTSCDCYWSTECGKNETCSYSSGCTHDGKLDGTCTTRGGGLGWGPISPAAVAAATDLYFQAYEAPVQGGGGRPDFNLVAEALAVGLEPYEEWHTFLQDIVHGALDRILGWDFSFPPAFVPFCLGNIKPHSGAEQAEGLVNVVKQAFVRAIKTGNPQTVRPALEEFWGDNERYVPRHSGRCTPHGHPEVHDETSSRECQVNELTKLLETLLEGREESREESEAGT
jgi:hypothetical protein